MSFYSIWKPIFGAERVSWYLLWFLCGLVEQFHNVSWAFHAFVAGVSLSSLAFALGAPPSARILHSRGWPVGGASCLAHLREDLHVKIPTQIPRNPGIFGHLCNFSNMFHSYVFLNFAPRFHSGFHLMANMDDGPRDFPEKSRPLHLHLLDCQHQGHLFLNDRKQHMQGIFICKHWILSQHRVMDRDLSRGNTKSLAIPLCSTKAAKTYSGLQTNQMILILHASTNHAAIHQTNITFTEYIVQDLTCTSPFHLKM